MNVQQTDACSNISSHHRHIVSGRLVQMCVYFGTCLSKGYANFPHRLLDTLRGAAVLLWDKTDPERHYHLSAKAQEFNELFTLRQVGPKTAEQHKIQLGDPEARGQLRNQRESVGIPR